jgi:hypothetical protein
VDVFVGRTIVFRGLSTNPITSPRRRWTVTAQFLKISLANATDALYNTSGSAIVRDTTGRSGNHVREEFDVYTWFELNRRVNSAFPVMFRDRAGRLMPGTYLSDLTKGPNHTYPYVAINFRDDGKSGKQ